MTITLSSPNTPVPVAREFMTTKLHTDGWPTLYRWRRSWWTWQGAYWVEIDEERIKSLLYAYTERAVYVSGDERKQWAPNRQKIAALLDALAAVCGLPEHHEQPSWLDGRDTGYIVPCQNGLLDMGSGWLLAPTPAYFNTTATPFDFDMDAPKPKAWLTFLNELWPDEPETRRTLQQWCGYVVSGRTDLQKMLLMVGAKRGGKGTVLGVLKELAGGSIYGPTAADLVGSFGLAPAVGKSLIVVADARFDGKTGAAAVERLLKISGEDEMAINRKNKGFWHGRLQSRVVIASNEFLEMEDASGAIVDRFIVLTLTRSWLNREDLTLKSRIAAELPGILNWALDGLDDLEAAGRFSVPEGTDDASETMTELGSAVQAFVSEKCVVGPLVSVKKMAIYDAFVNWCRANNVQVVSRNVFGKKLRAAQPAVRRTQLGSDGNRTDCYAGICLKLTVASLHG